MSRCARYNRDNTGETIGKLHVDYKTPFKHRVHAVYMCTCECGNQALMPIYMARKYESCGCAKKNRSCYLVIENKSVVREPLYMEKNYTVHKANMENIDV